MASIKGVASDINTAFPDMQQNAFGFTCDDPIEPTRVWYFVRPRATFKGSFKTGLGKVVEPTGFQYLDIVARESKEISYTLID